MMTNQEAFTKVVQHLRQQGERSIREEDEALRCRYRGEDGKMCAIGCLIPDEEYEPSMEGKAIETLLRRREGTFAPSLEEVSLSLLGALQRVHDGVEVCNWETALLCVALLYDLKMPPLEDEL
jgi:hypothetical protein